MFDRWSSMVPWWLLCVLLHFATPLRFFLSRKLRAKATAFLFGVVPLVIIVVLSPSTPEIVFLQRRIWLFGSRRHKRCGGSAVQSLIAMEVALGHSLHPSTLRAHLILRGGVVRLFCAGFEAYGSGSSDESTHFLQVFDADFAGVCLVRCLPSARRSSTSL